ncbi:MAG: 3-coathanger stack domain-containing protein [Bacteroidota bacterium]
MDKGTSQLLCRKAYDVKDLLLKKLLGGTTSSFLQSCDYTYQPNRFLKGINETMSATDLFSLQIGYDQGVPSLGAAAQYDGNIASLSWRFQGGVLQQYGYSYDEQNRVTAANYNLNNNAYGTTYGFDKRGNFTSITRRGVYSDGSSFTTQVIDNMQFTLQTGTNKLQTITDSAPCPTNKVVHQQLDNTELHATQQTITADNIVNDNADITFQAGTEITLEAGFHAKAGTNFTAKIEGCPQSGFETDGFVERSSASYQFDANGNRTFDPHLGISILYNYRNQPYRIIFPNGNTIEWLRSGSGEKLQRLQKRNGNPVKKLDYFSSFEYENDTVSTIYLENSKLTFESGIKSDYQYFLKNHLMSTQVVFKDDGNGVAEVVSQHQQYPFGYPMKGDFETNFKTKRLYNFKEAISDFGLGWMDFGARYYTDGAVPVFIGVDPIASSYPYVSPFNYAENEPINNIDLYGLQKFPSGLARGLDNARKSFNSATGLNVPLTTDVNIPIKKVNALKDGGALLKDVGGNVEKVGLGVALVAPPVGAEIAATGAGLQIAGHVMTVSGELLEEGEIKDNTKVELAIELAFEVLPEPLENALEKANLDEVTEGFVKAQIQAVNETTKFATQETVKKTQENNNQENCNQGQCNN